MTRIIYIPNRVIDANGIADGASIYVYQTGTTTPVSLFSDSGLATPISNPIVVAAGAAVSPFYTNDAGALRLRVVASDGSVPADEDPYSAPALASELTTLSTNLASTDSAKGASTIGRRGGGTVEDVIKGEYPLGAYAVAYDSTNEVTEAQDAFDAALLAGGAVTASGTVLVGSSGDAFGDNFNGAAFDAGINIGSLSSYDATQSIALRAQSGQATFKNFTADSDATVVVAQHIGKVTVGEGLTFDGNTSSSSPVANAFVFAGIGQVVLPSVLNLQNYRVARVCGTPRKVTESAHVGDVLCKNSYGNAGIFLGKPFGIQDIYHKGTIAIDGADGVGSGGVTIDADATSSDLDITPSSITSTGTTVTVTETAHGRAVGEYVYITGAAETAYNGMFEIASTPTADTFTYTARQTPSASPATGTLIVRPSHGPIKTCNLDRVVARNLTSDEGLWAVQVGDGIEAFSATFIEATNLDESSANADLGAFYLNCGSAHWPLKYATLLGGYAERTFNGARILIGRADLGPINLGRIDCSETGIGLDVEVLTEGGTSITDHGTIKSLSATISMNDKWDGATEGRAVRIGETNTTPSNALIEQLDIHIPYYTTCHSSLVSCIGVDNFRGRIGRVSGGFAVKSSNPFSAATWITLQGAIAIGGAKTISLTLEDILELGGTGLSGGKTGAGLELHAFDYIHIRGGILDGGTGDNQITSELLRLALPATQSNHDRLCNVVLEGVTFRNAGTGIGMENPTGVGAGDGYSLTLIGCTFESTVTTPIANVTRFEFINSVGTKGWLNDQIYTVATLPDAPTVGRGAKTWVSDADTPVLGSAVVGGSTTDIMVTSDGTNWIVG